MGVRKFVAGWMLGQIKAAGEDCAWEKFVVRP